MDISAVSRIATSAAGPDSPAPAVAKPAGGAAFGSLLSDAAERLAATQTHADSLALNAATGQPVELHEAVLAMEEASLSLQFALQIRNKAVEAYQEIMRMQI